METQLAQAWDEGDDWRGVSSAKERRRRQNRLHQRAYREKKRLQSFPQNSGAKADAEVTPDYGAANQQITSTRDARLMWWPLLNPNLFPVVLKCIQFTGIADEISQFLHGAYVRWSLNQPIARDLPTVTRLNAFDALIRNASILQIPVECLETDDSSSPFTCLTPTGEDTTEPQHPPHLTPTALQRAVAHHAWLDVFPFPGLRDNMLQGIEAGIYDEDRLCEDFCCDLLNLETESAALVVVWGDSWDAGGWEFSAEVMDKWKPLFQGCDDIVRATNYWRRRRGEMEI